MKNIIIGTSGHIDHGKTSLVKALTGIDLDTLKEEKSRGITINPGFTKVEINSKIVGLIDVPGHEKFMKNMLSGSHGIDLALLVIAANDGIMPQTIEHAEVLKILGVKNIVVALNKCDLVQKTKLKKLTKEILIFLKDLSFDKINIVETSIYDKQSIDKLKIVLGEKISQIETLKISPRSFRMAIDRVFSIAGSGVIVTGTTQGKNVLKGDILELMPSKKEVVVRGIQSHGKDVNILPGGSRGALNLSKISRDEIKKGCVIATPNSLVQSSLVDVEIRMLKNTDYKLKNNSEVRVFHQAINCIARVKLFEKDILLSGEKCYAQLVLRDPLIAQNQDKAVVRSITPQETVAGLKIINIAAQSIKRANKKYIEALKKSKTNRDILENKLKIRSAKLNNFETYQKEVGLPVDLGSELEELISEKKVVQLSSGILVHKNYIFNQERKIKKVLKKYHEENKLSIGMPIAIIQNTFFKDISKNNFREILSNFKGIMIKDQYLALSTFKIWLTKEQMKVKNMIINKLKDDNYLPRSHKELENSIKNEADFNLIWKMLLEKGIIVKVSSSQYFLDSILEKLKNELNTIYIKNKNIKLVDVKNLTNLSRKKYVEILDYFDSINFTTREGDGRKIKG